MNFTNQHKYILGQRVDFTTYKIAVEKIIKFAKQNKSSYICVSNVHMVMESYDNKDFQNIINNANIVTPDGAPLVWSLKLLGIKNAERVYGPKLMSEILKMCAKKNIPVGLYGGKREVINILKKKLLIDYPGLSLPYAYSPPFRGLTEKEKNDIISEIMKSNCKVLFVCLGCPKQEKWMSENSPNLSMPLLGVGAAFDFLADHKLQAPTIIQKIGFEWLFRLLTEPGRLWKRYLYNNPRFIFHIIKQYVF